MRAILRRTVPAAVGLGLLLGPATAPAQVTLPPATAAAAPVDLPAIATDRPDFTESSEVVRKGSVQFESGIRYHGEGRARSIGAPGALLRIGLGRRTELRMGADGYLSEAAQGIRVSGGSDLELGGKVRLVNQDRLGVDLALLPSVSLPTGAAAFTSGTVDPSLKIAWARELPAGFGLSGNVNFAAVSANGRRMGQRALSVSLGHGLAAGWGGYLEAFGYSRLEPDGGPAVTLDGGVARPFGPNFQFDIEAGRGLTAGAPDWFIGFGFALRGRLVR